jgi:hypothetical protein
MSAPDGRARLAEQQGALVRALTAQGEPPPEFDVERLSLAAKSLASKRRQEMARAWPALVRCLGERFRERFEAFAAKTPLPSEGGPLADGRAFARTLAEEEWTDEARLEVFGVDLRMAVCAGGLRPRRGVVVKWAWLREARRLVVGMRCPGVGARTMSVRIGKGAGFGVR